ncbi:hypothetical protein IMG5_172490 [Ichthyophthirius multifiliis]|uniref:Uncharacterized protein n=1 Tax=Ichthyophthirius multifiliis TaxID=5932 RepID=G0R1S4_ICHMU|nr:hypothetical protein IMG5_172490 [Ichthyophthirius multifiliis]EGR28576.1 hypothetical protein IMG5_172490 [Ichthyophthirius multifiliis]|eukprot:XP_004029812.1 hypothetical protein IMG5_172490 [Ichthyophthirius multifiliis]
MQKICQNMEIKKPFNNLLQILIIKDRLYQKKSKIQKMMEIILLMVIKIQMTMKYLLQLQKQIIFLNQKIKIYLMIF